MAVIQAIECKERFIGKLNYGSDLLEEITEICNKKNIQLGRIEAIGAVQKARLGFYNQQNRGYQFITIDKPLEIINLTGNISIKDNQPMVHAHVSLADDSGNAFGGHLAPGTIVFACECIIENYDGLRLERGVDDQTGLPLWNI